VLAACGSAPREPQRSPPAPEPTRASRPAPDAGLSNTVAPPPATDTDGDFVADAVDQCASVAEDWDAFADTDGCPDLDDDGDAIADAVDHCPDVKGSPSSDSATSALKRPGCPPQICKTLMIDTATRDCFLSTLSEAGMKDQDATLRQLVQEMSSYPEIEEVTLRAFHVPTEPKEAALARLEPIRSRLIALGWPARIKLVSSARRSGANPESVNLVNADISKQRFDYDKQFRRGICTLAGDVYRPERPEWRCRIRDL
jgi:hypothetical protein